MSKSPAFEYGVVLGSMQALFEQAAEEMARGFRAAVDANKRLRAMKGADPETWMLMERERRSIQKYEKAVRQERLRGAEFVLEKAAEVRARWGL